MTDKTERSETMLPCMNEQCGMHQNYSSANKINCHAVELVVCTDRAMINSCPKYTTTRPDAKDTASELIKCRALLEKTIAGWDKTEAELSEVSQEYTDLLVNSCDEILGLQAELATANKLLRDVECSIDMGDYYHLASKVYDKIDNHLNKGE